MKRPVWRQEIGARKTRERAMRYAEHGWPVAPLAVPRDGRCPCGLGACVEPHLVGNIATTDAAMAAASWGDHGWDIALVTSWFDVVDFPASLGAVLHQQLRTTCPTAMAPHGRRWHFYLHAGSLRPDLVNAGDGVLHAGGAGWIAAPGTRTETTGRIRWLVHPYQTRWQPHRRMDPFDRVFAGLGDTGPQTPGMPPIVDAAIE